jgi:hypothetical protein
MMPTTFLIAELRRQASATLPALGLALGAAGVAASALIVPRLPATAKDVLALTMRVGGDGELVLVNSLLAVWFAAFCAGGVAVLRAVVEPRAQGSLELLLAKPVTPAWFALVRTAPALATTLAVGALLAVAQEVALAPTLALPDRLEPGAGLWTGLAVTALAMVQTGLVAALTARLADLSTAVGVAVGVFVAPLLPLSVFAYRPDLFTGDAPGRDLLLAPASLVWHAPTAAAWAPGLAVASVALTGVALAWTARRLREA